MVAIRSLEIPVYLYHSVSGTVLWLRNFRTEALPINTVKNPVEACRKHSAQDGQGVENVMEGGWSLWPEGIMQNTETATY